MSILKYLFLIPLWAFLASLGVILVVSVVSGVVAILAVAFYLIVPLRRVPAAYNVRNLRVRWLTTLLTSAAVTLVVALLIFMLAFVNGMNKLTEGSGQPGNVIVLSDGATDELFSNLRFDDIGDVAREPGIEKDDRGRPLCSRELYVVANQVVPTPPGEKERRRFVQVRGIEDPLTAGRVHGIELQPGGAWFSDAGVQAQDGEDCIQAVLGEGVAAELGADFHKKRLEPGDVFELGPRKWVVVGVLRSSGSTFNSEIWAKAQKVGEEYGKKNVFSSIVLRTAGPEAARDVSERLRGYKKAALAASPETEYYAKLTETNNQFKFAIYVIAAVMALGGMLGLMVTMFAAMSQRVKDIAVLRILGFARWQVLMSFLMETLLIAVLGGVLGCALGSLAHGWSAVSIVGSGTGAGKSIMLKLVVDGRTLGTGLIFALLMGGAGGLLPALSAMRLRPLESLR